MREARVYWIIGMMRVVLVLREVKPGDFAQAARYT